MDVLTHLFLPLTVAFAVRREWFDSPAWLALGGFGLLSDFDKFLGAPGLLHSLGGVVAASLALLGAGRLLDREFDAADFSTAARLAVAFVWSHLLLDVIDGGPVPLLFPMLETGIGLRYPAKVAFGVEPLGIAVRGSLVALRTTAPRAGFNAYGFLNGFGVASALTFAAIYLGAKWEPSDNDIDMLNDGEGVQNNELDCRESGGDHRDGGDR
jgi:membrane-bound metal-dependent hydrolase YbcI (DUF457 family)